MQQSHIAGCFVGSPHEILCCLLDERVGGWEGPEGAEEEDYGGQGFVCQFLGSLFTDGILGLVGLERGPLTDAVAIGGRRAEGIGAF